MNKLTKKLTAISLSVALCLGSAGAVFALNGDGQQKAEEAKRSGSQTAQSASERVEKEETVYVLAGSDGSTKRIIVSDRLRNPDASQTLHDVSELTQIENVKGDETFTQGADGALVWNAGGNDICYQGESEAELPVRLDVRYTLDGEEISAGELAGKSGRVCIRFDYTPLRYETVQINGTSERLCVPFAMLTGLVLEDDVFRNVEVSNGKLIHDGERTFVLGLAFAGACEDLGITREIGALPDFLEITADVTDFELGMSVTAASSAVFYALDEAAFDSEARLTQTLTQAAEGAQALTDGAAALADGLGTLLESVGTLAGGVEELATGAQSLSNGADALYAGAVQVDSGLTELSAGLDTLTQSSAALNSGAEQIFAVILSSAQQQLQAAGVSVPALDAANYAEILTGAAEKLESSGATQGAQTVLALKDSLDHCNTFCQGVYAYTAGVDAAAIGAAQLGAGTASLKNGAAQLSTGADSLLGGIKEVQNAMPALQSGVAELYDGAGSLSDGLDQLYAQSVQKLTELMQEDPETFLARLHAMVELSESYNSFSGIRTGMDGTVKFLFRTEEIRAD